MPKCPFTQEAASEIGMRQTDGQMHSTAFMTQWHFYNRLLAALFCWWLQLRSSRFCPRQHKFSPHHLQWLWAQSRDQPQNVAIFTFNANLTRQTTNERNTTVEIQPQTCLHISKWVLWCVEFPPQFARFTPSRPLKTLVMLRPSGSSAFLSWREMRIFSAPCVHHFILININLMRWEFRNSPIYDLPPCHWYLEIDFLHEYGRFNNLWYTMRISNQSFCFFLENETSDL